jgi:hypothetical protein
VHVTPRTAMLAAPPLISEPTQLHEVQHAARTPCATRTVARIMRHAACAMLRAPCKLCGMQRWRGTHTQQARVVKLESRTVMFSDGLP